MGSRTRVVHQEDQEVAIAIEDEVEDGVGEVQEPRGGRVTRQGSRVQERERLCEFPPGESPCVTVTYKDYKTLEHDTWLNDIIIDFFLAWLYREVLEEEDRLRVHIFTTMFYSRLTTAPKKITLENSFEKDKSLSAKAKRHIRVRGWTKKVDLFSKDLVIFPICENNSHWYLVAAVLPGREGGFIFVLDSLGGGRKRAVENILNYLSSEWEAKMPEKGDFPKMELLAPAPPQQDNYSDCGVFLLHYVDWMFTSVDETCKRSKISSINESWFPAAEVSKKRAFIAVTIRRLTEKQRPGELVSWPKIEFSAEKSGVFRGSQIWDCLDEEFRTESPMKLKRSRGRLEKSSSTIRNKPAVVTHLKEQSDEWERNNFEDGLELSTSRGRGSRENSGRGDRGIIGESASSRTCRTSEWDFSDLQDDVDTSRVIRGRGKRRGGGKKSPDPLPGLEVPDLAETVKWKSRTVDKQRGDQNQTRPDREALRARKDGTSWSTGPWRPFQQQGLNDTASAGIGDLASMRRASLKKSDQLFENIELREYDKEAEQKLQNIKSFRIPKKGEAVEQERGDNKPVTVAVNNILKDLDGVVEVHIAQEKLPMLEEEEELEVTEIEVVVME